MTAAGERASDRGSGTTYAIVVLAVLTTLALGAAAVGGAVTARHQAMTAADLAALAAADALARADADPCAVAERIASRHEVALFGCELDGMVIDVVVGAPVGGLAGLGLVARMQARAGPGGGEAGE